MIKQAGSRTMSDLLREIDKVAGLQKQADEAPGSAVDGEDPTKKKPQVPSGEIKSDLSDNSPSTVSGAPTNNATQPTASIGLTSGHTDDMPLPEKVKDTKDDPGTSTGLKTAAVDYSQLSLAECLKVYKALGDEVLAEVQVKHAKQANAAVATTAQTPSNESPAAAAGYAAAKAADSLQKMAAERQLLRKVAEDAVYAAYAVTDLLKRAEAEEDKESPDEKAAEPAAAPAAAPEAPPAGGPPPMDPAMAGGGAPVPMDPAMAAGGMPSAGGGDPAADKQEAIMLILSVMEEAGIAPEELMAQMAGGMAPPPPGASPEDTAAAVKTANLIRPLLPVVAEATSRYHTDAKLRQKMAQRKVIRQTIRELVGRK